MIEFASITSDTENVRPADLEGHLLVIEPLEYRQGMQTSMGESDAVLCRVHDITEKTTHEDVMFFSRVLVGRLSKMIGRKVLGVMGKGDAKPGQSAPWVIISANENPKAVKAATDYLVQNVTEELTPEPESVSADDLVAELAKLGAKAI